MTRGDISQTAAGPRVAFDFDDLIDPSPSLLIARLERWAAKIPFIEDRLRNFFLSFKTLNAEAERIIWWIVAEKDTEVTVFVRRPYSVFLIKTVEDILEELPSVRLHLVLQNSPVEQAQVIRVAVRQFNISRVVLSNEFLVNALPTTLVKKLEQWDEEVIR